jgi:DNA-binding NtrC family response regulator
MTALIVGEPGVGPEAIARRIHALSRRRDARFIAVRTTSRDHGAIERELFGFAGLTADGAPFRRRGMFEEAHRGTLFLDEVNALSPGLQAQTIRALQDRGVRRADSGQHVDIDVRLIAATTVDLARAVEDGSFNWDLYFRLNIFPIKIPPLRERREDIPAIAEAIRMRFANENDVEPPRIPRRVQYRMMEYDWPGNVQELEQYIARALIMHAGRTSIEFDPPMSPVPDLPARWRPPMQDWTLERLEREYIAWVLQRTGGHQGEAARVLGISRRTLYRRLRDDARNGVTTPADGPRPAPVPELEDDEFPDPGAGEAVRRNGAGVSRDRSPRNEASPG